VGVENYLKLSTVVVVVVVGGVGVGGVRLQFKPILEDFRTPPPPLPIIIARSLVGVRSTYLKMLSLMHAILTKNDNKKYKLKFFKNYKFCASTL